MAASKTLADFRYDAILAVLTARKELDNNARIRALRRALAGATYGGEKLELRVVETRPDLLPVFYADTDHPEAGDFGRMPLSVREDLETHCPEQWVWVMARGNRR